MTVYAITDTKKGEQGLTLKSGLGVTQDHWKWHHLIDRILYFLPIFLVPIGVAK